MNNRKWASSFKIVLLQKVLLMCAARKNSRDIFQVNNNFAFRLRAKNPQSERQTIRIGKWWTNYEMHTFVSSCFFVLVFLSVFLFVCLFLYCNLFVLFPVLLR